MVEITLQSQQQATQLQQQASTLAEQNVVLKKQATTDALTGLANRATFDQFAADHVGHPPGRVAALQVQGMAAVVVHAEGHVRSAECESASSTGTGTTTVPRAGARRPEKIGTCACRNGYTRPFSHDRLAGRSSAYSPRHA